MYYQRLSEPPSKNGRSCRSYAPFKQGSQPPPPPPHKDKNRPPNTALLYNPNLKLDSLWSESDRSGVQLQIRKIVARGVGMLVFCWFSLYFGHTCGFPSFLGLPGQVAFPGPFGFEGAFCINFQIAVFAQLGCICYFQ